MFQTRKRLWGAAVVAGALAVGGSAARADQTLTLTLTDGNKGFSIAITNDVTTSQVSYTITVGSGPSSGSFQLDGQTVSYNSGTLTGSFAITNPSTLSFTDGSFANFSTNVTVQSNSPNTGGNTAKIFDTSIDTKNTGSAGDDLIASVSSNGFVSPGVVGGGVTLFNSLSVSNLDNANEANPGSARATLTSQLNSQTPLPGTAVVTADQFQGGKFGDSTNMGYILDSNPYTLSNTLTIKNLGVGDAANVTGTTRLTATPEPATLALAVSGLPVLGVFALRRRRKARA